MMGHHPTLSYVLRQSYHSYDRLIIFHTIYICLLVVINLKKKNAMHRHLHKSLASRLTVYHTATILGIQVVLQYCFYIVIFFIGLHFFTGSMLVHSK